MEDAIAFEGAVMLGSRLKRLAERFQAGAERIAVDCGLPTQPSQMPLLTALYRHGPLSVGDLADQSQTPAAGSQDTQSGTTFQQGLGE